MYPIVFVKTIGIGHPEMERNRKYFRVYAKTRKKKYFLFSLGTQDFKISFSEVTKLKKKKKIEYPSNQQYYTYAQKEKSSS